MKNLKRAHVVMMLNKARVVVMDEARVVAADEARVVVAVQHLADNERMSQTCRRTKAFLLLCLRLPWKVLDLSAQTLS